MKITQTVELNDEERLTVSSFLKLVEDISNVAGCCMDDVYNYFVDRAEITGTNTYSICSLHQLSDF